MPFVNRMGPSHRVLALSQPLCFRWIWIASFPWKAGCGGTIWTESDLASTLLFHFLFWDMNSSAQCCVEMIVSFPISTVYTSCLYHGYITRRTTLTQKTATPASIFTTSTLKIDWCSNKPLSWSVFCILCDFNVSGICKVHERMDYTTLNHWNDLCEFPQFMIFMISHYLE